MDPARKRRIRLVTALTAAILLAGALVYTSFTAANDEVTAGTLVASAQPGRSYKLAGTVVSARRTGPLLEFRIRDPKTPVSALVRYHGTVPDPFRVGRGVIVTVHRQGPAFVGEKDSLITKCPSKYTAKATPS